MVILDDVYVGQERVSRDEIYRRAVAAGIPAGALGDLDALPEGEYSYEEIVTVLDLAGQAAPAAGGEAGTVGGEGGVPAAELPDEDLLRELGELHRTRHDTLRHGSDQALERHTERLAELEGEYLRRNPRREVDPQRLRSGARERAESRAGDAGARAGDAGTRGGEAGTAGAGAAGRPTARTGAEQPWDPEDLAVAEGHDPTPAAVEHARRELAEDGPAAIERTVP